MLQHLHSEVIAPQKKMPAILIVDDEVLIRELCAKALKGYDVFQAGTCSAALRMYEKESIDLILTDVMMPGGTGLDLLRQIGNASPHLSQTVQSALKRIDRGIVSYAGIVG